MNNDPKTHECPKHKVPFQDFCVGCVMDHKSNIDVLKSELDRLKDIEFRMTRLRSKYIKIASEKLLNSNSWNPFKAYRNFRLWSIYDTFTSNLFSALNSTDDNGSLKTNKPIVYHTSSFSGPTLKQITEKHEN